MLTEFVTQMLDGLDLVKYDFLVPIVCCVILILSISLLFRSLITIFNTFFK